MDDFGFTDVAGLAGLVSWAEFKRTGDGSGAGAGRGPALPSIVQVVTFKLTAVYGFRAVQP